MGRKTQTVDDDHSTDNELSSNEVGKESQRYQGSKREAKGKAKEAWQALMPKKRNPKPGSKGAQNTTGKEGSPRKPSQETQHRTNSYRAPDITLNTSEEEDIEDIGDEPSETQTRIFKAQRRHEHTVKSRRSEQDEPEGVEDLATSQKHTAGRHAHDVKSKKSGVAGADDTVEVVPKVRRVVGLQRKSKKSEVSQSPKSSLQAKAHTSSQKLHRSRNESESSAEDVSSGDENTEDEDEEGEEEEEEGLEGMNPSALGALLDAEAVSWADEGDTTFDKNTRSSSPATPPVPTRKLTLSQAGVVSPHSARDAPEDASVKHAAASAKKRRKETLDSDGEDGRTVSPPPKKKGKPSKTLSSTSRRTSADLVQTNASRKKTGAHKSPSVPQAADKKKRTASKGTRSASGKKRTRADESIEWADQQDGSSANDSIDNSPQHPSKCQQVKSQDDDSDDNLSGDFSDLDDRSIDIVYAERGKKLKLTEQHPRVRRVALLAIQEIQRDVCLINAFPDGPEKSYSFARGSLLRSAKTIGDTELCKKLKTDQKYWTQLCSIPGQRVPNLRGKIKKLTDSLPLTVFDVRSGDVRKVGWLQDGLRYIYPHNYKNNTVDGTKAFSAPFFCQILCGAFFSSPTSFGFRIVNHFKSSLPDKPDEKEIPAPMLALVSTAVFASIEDYRSSRYRAGEFRANIFLDYYQANMDVLSNIKHDNLRAYHALMHGLYLQACGVSGGNSSVVRAVAMTFLNTKDMSAE